MRDLIKVGKVSGELKNRPIEGLLPKSFIGNYNGRFLSRRKSRGCRAPPTRITSHGNAER